MEKEWYLHFKNETIGPFRAATLLKMIELGKISVADFVWTKESGQWKKISDYSEFREAVPTPPPASEGTPAPAPRPKELSVQDVESAAARVPSNQGVRRGERITIEAVAYVEELGDTVPILNISETGMLLQYTRNPKPSLETELRLRIQSPSLDGQISVIGIVTLHSSDKQEPGFAIAFLGIKREDQESIRRLIRQQVFGTQGN